MTKPKTTFKREEFLDFMDETVAQAKDYLSADPGCPIRKLTLRSFERLRDEAREEWGVSD